VTPLLLTWADLAWAATPHGSEAQDFTTPAAVLVAGLVVGYVFLSRATESDASIDEESREIDLGATRDEVLEALRQLEVERPKMSAEDYEHERQQLLARGASALRELDDEDGDGEPAADRAATPAREPASSPIGGVWESLAPEWRGAIAALSAVAVVALLFFGLQGDTRERREGDSITGGDIVSNNNAAPQGLEGANPQLVAQIKALETQLKENPNDVQTLNELTQLYLSAGVPEQAFQYNNQVRELAPDDRDARAYLGVLRMMMGMGDRAIEAFDGVLAEDPDHLLATFYKGLVLLELRRFDEAVAAFERAMELDPGNPKLAQAAEQAKAMASGEPPPMPSGGELIVRGTLDIDPAAKATLRGNEVVFASVKDPSKAGPPVAAIKLPASFPAPFQITTADMRAMGAGTVVPDQLSLTVRVDIDGNAMTREKAPMAVVNGLSKGADGVGVKLTLDGAPVEGAPMAPPSAGGGGETLVSGTVTLAPGQDASGILYVSLRPAGGGGPPVAAKRFQAPRFPLQFVLTKADIIPMMAGRPVPAQLTLKAHIDRDGNVSTKEDGPAAELASVERGATGVQLRLE